ncbi:MAG: hypothetical protein K5644_04630, partial [Lachnospiraceae bacterium]|nr:hypothetical protein [Lachnospiraceae bacterium]
KDEKLTFASQESFWKDFMKEDFDIEGFREYYDTLVDGHIDIEKLKAEGKTLRDAFNEPYHDYINNTHFIGRVFTEEELYQYVDEQVRGNQDKKKSLYDLLKDSCPEGINATFRFAGESEIYSFYDFIDEFMRRSNDGRERGVTYAN